MDPEVRRAFAEAADSPDDADLPRAALLLPRLERRSLDPAPYLARLARLGATAATRIERLGALSTVQAQVESLNTLLFEEEGFRGNVAHYDDPRNSFLNDVLDRRTGIPIALAVVYMDVGRRAGLLLEGVNFPGHFLVRCRAGARDPDRPRDLVVDPFNKGVPLSESDCRQLLRKTVGDEATFDRRLLAAAGKRQILRRMLHNLKQLYVNMRSLPQARAVVDLLLALDPLDGAELRDRGLLGFHQQDYPSALRDLETYFRSVPKVPSDADDEQRQEYERLWEHLKALRRKVASLN